MTPTVVGYGAGDRDIDGVPNVARLMLGEAHPAQGTESVVLLETNVDHIPAEQLAFAAEELLAEGALDVWQAPVVMKKGRLAVALSVLVTERDAEQAASRIQELTGTLGVRRIDASRYCLDRDIIEVGSVWGPVRVKMSEAHGRAGVRPEHDDVARIARETGIAYAEVRDRIVDEQLAGRNIARPDEDDGDSSTDRARGLSKDA